MDKYENEWGSLDIMAELFVGPINGFWIIIGIIAVVVALLVATHFPPKKEY